MSQREFPARHFGRQIQTTAPYPLLSGQGADRGSSDDLEKHAYVSAMFRGETLGRRALCECDDARRAAVEIHWDRLSVSIEHLVGTNARNHGAAFYGECIGRAQRVTRLVVGQLLKSNRLVSLGAGAERTGWTTEHFALVTQERYGSHIGVNRASAGLTDSHL